MGGTRWEKNARNRNRARDRKMPLLAWGGVADQVVPDWTPEAVEERVTRIVANFHQSMQDAHARRQAVTDLYIFHLRVACPDLDLEEINEQFERRWGGKPIEYRADFWCGQLAEHTGRTKLDIFNDVKAELEGRIND